jgi:hypothetical protein
MAKVIDPKRVTGRVLFVLPNVFGSAYTAKTLYRKCKTNIPRNESAQLIPNFQINGSVSGLYTPTIGRPILLQVDRSWEYINRSQIHECGTWERGHAVSFLGIHNLDLVCSVLDSLLD